ncbi:MAG: acyl carrier protein [Lachnospiraceae bacterium]|nr:acyl carrier protein [Lachnospiraceae bacterium]
MNEIKQFIIEKLEEASGIDGVKEESLLFEEEILDSLSILYLVGEVEEQYGIQIPLEDVIEDNFCTVNHIALYLKNRM